MNCFFDTSTERSYNDRCNIYFVLCSPFSQFKRELSILYIPFSSCLVTALFSSGRVISQIHKIFFALSSNVKSGLIDVVAFLKWNSNSHTSFAWPFFMTYSLCTTFACTTSCFYLPNWIPLPIKLPISSKFCYAWSDTLYLPTICIQPKHVLPFSFVGHTDCIYYIRQALLKLSIIL